MSEVYGYSNPINFPLLSKIENFNNWVDLRLSSSSLILWDDKTEPYSQHQRPRGATDLSILINRARMREMSDITIGKWMFPLNVMSLWIYSAICTRLFAIIFSFFYTQLLESKIFRHESIQLFSLDSRTTHNFVESSRSFEQNSGK